LTFDEFDDEIREDAMDHLSQRETK